MFANYRGVSVTTQLVNVFFNGGVPAVRYTQNQRRIQSTLTLYSRTPRLLSLRVSFRFSVYKVRASSLQFILLASGLLGVLNLPMEIARSCIQRMLKVVNSLVGISGLLVMFYGCWMFAFSQSHVGCSDDALSFWFIYTTILVGFSVYLIACTGQIAAETCSTCFLYTYVLFIYIFHLLETNLVANVFLNKNWEEGLPKDTTGNIDKIKYFIEDNYEISKWIGLFAVTLPAVCASLALILKALEPGYLEGRQDYALDIAPLLENYVAQQRCHVVDIDFDCGSKQE